MKRSITKTAAGSLLILVILCVFLSCLTVEKQEKLLAPLRSTSEIRLDDIKKNISENPIMAIDLINIYRNIYDGDPGEKMTAETAQILVEFENEAVENLRVLQSTAVTEERWEDAASLNRSLSSLGVKADNAGLVEADFILADAKKKLASGNDLGAFLAAVQAHEQRPLSFSDALLFLERAVQARQRRTAVFFLNATNAAIEAGPEAAASVGRQIPAELREYAQGSDTVSDMLRGVATVLVDRGFRTERGRGMIPDRALGSAFFVDASGLLITNYHVISSEVDPKYEGHSKMSIRMGDSASLPIPAKVVGWDKALDLALIKAEYKPDFVFSVVDQVIPRVADTVLAIGSPGGLEKTVTSGIVSNSSRRLLQIGDVIQIDASVNHGNSGGPVVDSVGRLVGIVFAGIEHYQNLNFAVPAERLAAALPAMIKGGKAERPWLGLALNETSSGAEIIYAAPNTPSFQHRVAEGSIIKTINGEKVSAAQGLLIPALQDAIFQHRPGELVALETAAPNGEVKRQVMMTTLRPEIPLSEAAKIDSKERMTAPLFGMILSPSQGSGFSSSYQVKKVIRGSPADGARISAQDQISIRNFRVVEIEGYFIAAMGIEIRGIRMATLETFIQLYASLDSSDML